MWKLRLYDSQKFWANDYEGMELLSVVESESDFENNLLIDGKTYKICAICHVKGSSHALKVSLMVLFGERLKTQENGALRKVDI